MKFEKWIKMFWYKKRNYRRSWTSADSTSSWYCKVCNWQIRASRYKTRQKLTSLGSQHRPLTGARKRSDEARSRWSSGPWSQLDSSSPWLRWTLFSAPWLRSLRSWTRSSVFDTGCSDLGGCGPSRGTCWTKSRDLDSRPGLSERLRMLGSVLSRCGRFWFEGGCSGTCSSLPCFSYFWLGQLFYWIPVWIIKKLVMKKNKTSVITDLFQYKFIIKK